MPYPIHECEVKHVVYFDLWPPASSNISTATLQMSPSVRERELQSMVIQMQQRYDIELRSMTYLNLVAL